MATRVALERELDAAPERAFFLLSDRDFTRRRLALEPALAAELTDYASSDTELRLDVTGELPAQWMPAGVDATPHVRRLELWQRDGDGYAGRLTMDVNGLPIQCAGTLELRQWQGITVLSLTLDIDARLPFVGQIVERMIRDRMSPAFEAEFELLATELTQ